MVIPLLLALVLLALAGNYAYVLFSRRSRARVSLRGLVPLVRQRHALLGKLESAQSSASGEGVTSTAEGPATEGPATNRPRADAPSRPGGGPVAGPMAGPPASPATPPVAGSAHPETGTPLTIHLPLPEGLVADLLQASEACRRQISAQPDEELVLADNAFAVQADALFRSAGSLPPAWVSRWESLHRDFDVEAEQYNKLVRRFNDSLGRFPGNWVGRLLGLKALPPLQRN